MSAPRAFYDDFTSKLLRDYATGNARMERALRFALAELPGGAADVLDLGCGLGWSSHEIARHRPEARIVGADLSPRLLEMAGRLFGGEERIRYEVRDFLDDPVEGAFDAILLLDVYEHFPAAAREGVHGRLARLLRPSGMLVLTVPSPDHQRYLREHFPAGLQPVDEDVGPAEIERLAADLSCRVERIDTVTVWRPGDYLHTVLRRDGARPGDAAVRLEPRDGRRARIRRALGMRWTDGAGLLASAEGPPVCVATPALDRASETFIRAHLERLPATVHALYGSPRPHRTDEGRSVLPWLLRAGARVAARLARCDKGALEDRLFALLPGRWRARLVARALRRLGVRAVLAEYGPVAAGLHDACLRAGLPLIPHFHGFDAFQEDVVAEHRDTYRAIFRRGHPVVAVSGSMKRRLIELGASEGQVVVAPCGVDVADFRPGERTPGAVVAVGRFVDKKAPELTVLAFARVLERVPGARLTMVGDGPLLASVRRLVRGMGLHDTITLQGVRGHAAVADLLASAALFVQHSVVAPNGDREGTPVSVLEAAAAGLPVVATRHEGIAEVVVDGETGLLVDEGDVAAMADAMAALLADPDRASRLGAAGRRRVEEAYSMQHSLGRLWTAVAGAATRA